MLEIVKSAVRPITTNLRATRYKLRYNSSLKHLKTNFGRTVVPCKSITTGASQEDLWKQLQQAANQYNIGCTTVSLSKQVNLSNGGDYWERYGKHYKNIGHGREKALEHALTFKLLDFSKVKRYCDVAAAISPIENSLLAEWSQVEYWKQDILYKTDLDKKIVGGLAQNMAYVESGFFDAMTLHCSFEHFNGSADTEFIAEVDRVLSPIGACLILPLYTGLEHKIYFDPTVVSSQQLSQYDSEAELCPLYYYMQEHGRFYSPGSLASRILKHLPTNLRATLINFTDQNAVSQEIYLNFGLVLHRAHSVFNEEVFC